MSHFKHVVINIHWAKIKIDISELLQLTKYIKQLIWLLTRKGKLLAKHAIIHNIQYS